MTDTVSTPTEQFYGWLKQMRDTQPVHEDDRGAWHLFRHADVTTALSDPTVFSSDTTKLVPASPETEPFAKGNIVTMDPPKHRAMRGLIVKVFTPRLVDALIPRITEVTNELLDEADTEGRFDLVDALAYPLPVIVIAQLLGVPAQDRPAFRRWAEALFDVTGADGGPVVIPDEAELAAIMANMSPVLREMNDYLLAQLRPRRDNPTDDLLGRLASAEVDGQRLSDVEIVGFAAVLLLAGHVTTTATLGNAMWSFLAQPQTMTELRANPELLTNAIDESLRFRSPFPRLGRVSMREVEIGGRVIPEGRIVVPWLASANRDPEKFTDPDRFDIHRDTNGFLSFGHGIHFCIGARLARLEAKVALRILLARYAEITADPAAPAVLRNPYVMTGVTRLPLLVRG